MNILRHYPSLLISWAIIRRGWWYINCFVHVEASGLAHGRPNTNAGMSQGPKGPLKFLVKSLSLTFGEKEPRGEWTCPRSHRDRVAEPGAAPSRNRGAEAVPEPTPSSRDCFALLLLQEP